MIVAIIILAWLLASTWITMFVICKDEGYQKDEVAGIILACLFSPISVCIIRPVVLMIKRIKKGKRKKDTEKIYCNGKVYTRAEFDSLENEDE